MTEDTSLLRAFADHGDQAAFAALVQRHIGLVYHAALRQLGEPPLAEDATQVVFTRLARRAAALTRHSSLGGWLHTTTRFVASEYRRTEWRRRQREQEAHRMQQLSADTPGTHEWERLRPVIDEALGALGETDREIVLLRFFECLSLAAVGTRLAISENAARMRIDRALDKLQARLARRGVTSSAAALAAGLGQQGAFAAPSGLAASVTTHALAAAAAPAGLVAASFVQLMTTSKVLTLATGALAALALGLAYHQNARADALATELSARDRAHAALTTSLRAAEQRARHLEAASTAERPAPGPTPPPPAPAAAPARTAVRDSLEEVIDRLVASRPDLAQLYVRQQTIRYRSHFGPLYRTLGLSPAQIERFERALAEHAQASSDIRIAGIVQGSDKNDPAVQQLLTKAADERDAALRVVLGEPDYARYQDYEHTYGARRVAEVLASNLYYTAQPISADQADALTRIAAIETKGFPTSAASWDAILSRAQGVLAPEQLAVLQNVREQTELGRQIAEITRPVVQQLNQSAGTNRSPPAGSASAPALR